MVVLHRKTPIHMAMSTLIHPHSALQELIDIWIQNPTSPSFDKLGENGGKWWKMVENGGKWWKMGTRWYELLYFV